MVEGSVKQLEIGNVGGVSCGNFGEDSCIPGIFGGSLQAFESGPGWDLRVDICAGLVGRDEGYADSGGDVGRVEGVDNSKTRGGGHIVAGWILDQCVVCISVTQKGRVCRWGRVEVATEVDCPFWCSVPALQQFECSYQRGI